MMVSRARHAFTLIEILVVIVLIAILAAVLYPVVGKAREKSRMVMCMSNQRQIAEALQAYAQQHNDTFPGIANAPADDSSWRNDISDQLDSTAIFVCPNALGGRGQQRTDYGLNANLVGVRVQYVADPVKAVLTADAKRNLIASSDDVDTARHGKGYLVSFVDGHVAFLRADASSVIFADGDEGSLLSFGAAGMPITFKDNVTAVGVSETVDEGAVVVLVNNSNTTLVPTVSVSGGQVTPDQGLIPGVSNVQIAPDRCKAFSLYCVGDTFTSQKVETTYRFGDGKRVVTIVVRKPAVTAFSSGAMHPARQESAAHHDATDAAGGAQNNK